jgi:GTP pyrophosphokinase
MKSRHAELSPAVLSRVAEATADLVADQPDALVRARAFALPLIAGETLDTGENTLTHADAVVAILRTIGGSEHMQAASYLVYACDHLNRPQEVIAKSFGANLAALAMETTQLVRVQRQARASQQAQASTAALAAPMAQTAAIQTENIRKMLLAFSRDLRVVMLRLASRLQTLRHFAASKLPVPPGLARESLQVFAPLANRLGIWEIKWEMEDLAFRFLEPDTYREVARLAGHKRGEREAASSSCAPRSRPTCAARASPPPCRAGPKHIYSIVKKMRGKSLDFARSTTSARCASSSPRWPIAMAR